MLFASGTHGRCGRRAGVRGIARRGGERYNVCRSCIASVCGEVQSHTLVIWWCTEPCYGDVQSHAMVKRWYTVPSNGDMVTYRAMGMWWCSEAMRWECGDIYRRGTMVVGWCTVGIQWWSSDSRVTQADNLKCLVCTLTGTSLIFNFLHNNDHYCQAT